MLSAQIGSVQLMAGEVFALISVSGQDTFIFTFLFVLPHFAVIMDEPGFFAVIFPLCVTVTE